MTVAHTRVYRDGVCVEDGFPLHQVSELLADTANIVWVDFCEPDGVHLSELAAELGVHELALEDALSEHQRPKVDTYDSHLFVAAHAISMNAETAAMTAVEVDAFVGRRWLITVRKSEAFDMAKVVRRWERSGDLAKFGPAYMLYGLLDVIIDEYFVAVEVFDEFYDTVSDGIFADTPMDPARQQHWFQMRQALVRFHRLAVPMREAVSALMRREHHVVADEMYPYLQDLYDHILRITESTDALRDLVSTIVETNISLRDYRQNQVMKRVTSWAAIIAVPTLITGFYGMNVPYSGYGTAAGFYASVALIVVLSLVLYLVFKAKEWL